MILDVLLACMALAATLPIVHALWPKPKSALFGNTTLSLSHSLSERSHTPSSPSRHSHLRSFHSHISLDSIESPPKDLLQAIYRTEHSLRSDRNVYLSESFGSDVLASSPVVGDLSALRLSLLGTTSGSTKSIFEEAIKPIGERDESYSLLVPCDGSDASLSATTSLGLLRGLSTFEQLWFSSPSDKSHRYAPKLPIKIDDAPWFSWRGLGLDTARNFYPVRDIKRTLDAMCMAKLNVFYWHIVDSQSFPLFLPEDPILAALSQNGAYAPGMVYSPEDVECIVKYAGERGIDVVVEIDTPGHTDIVAKSYPDFVACHTKLPWATYAQEPPAGQLRFYLPEVISFVSSLFRATSALFPGGYFSSGGDEINMRCFKDDNITQSYLTTMNITLDQSLHTFTQKTHAALASIGKTPVVWQEMALAHDEVKLRNETLVITWISSEDAKAVTEKGFNIIHAPSDHFYLDCGQGGWLGNSQGASWCPFVTWQNMYAFDPYSNITSQNEHLVQGGQTMLWSEQTDSASLDSTIWPRAAAAAGLWWEGGPAGSYPLDGKSALPAMHDLRFRMIDRGIGANTLQPLWCALRPGACDLTA